MITFTHSAQDKALLAVQGAASKALRLAVKGGGCSGLNYAMSMDTGEPGPLDRVHSYGELKVYVDSISAMYLDGLQVDYVESLENSGFRFNNPKATRTCGCGNSFSA
jgi:iron-sulfur cluster assembly accessory protein